VKRYLYVLLSLVVLTGMILAGCGPKATPAATEAPPVTEAPPATEAPTEIPFEVMMQEAPNCDYGGEFMKIEAVDEFTVKFSLCYADPAFLSKVAFSAFPINSKEYLEQTGGTGEILEKPNGTGPYLVEQWDRGNQLVFKAFDGYWGEKAKTPTLVFRWSTESAQRLLELQSGTVDGIDNPGPDDFAKIEADPTLKLMKRAALNVFYIGMNNTFPPFDNEKVRQAVAQGIDRQRIVDTFYPAGSEAADYFTPCAIPNGCVGDPWYTFDATAAKALLAEAGFPDGFETKLFYRDVVRGYLPQVSLVAQDIQAQLKANLNIDAKIEVMESGAFLDAADSGNLDGLHLLGWGADYPDQTNFLDYHFGAGSSKQFGDKFTDLTDVLKQAAALAGDEARKPLYEQANSLLKQHVPMIPVAHGGSGTAYKAAIENPQASPLTSEVFYVSAIPGQDTFVWMQNAEPISLYCPDETDGESLRPCEQVMESLYTFEVNDTAAIPALAEKCEANTDLTEWTCTLRQGVLFHDGSSLDANDVVMSYIVQWDAANPLHKGNTGAFTYFSSLFGAFLNAPPA
jgi:ABC-type transport system substrate-binding protein